jgi:hypothetical protein
MRLRPARVLATLLVLAGACSDDDDACPPEDPLCNEPAPTLDDVLPEVPAPTGEPQAAWAGRVTADAADALIPGPAAAGRVGDYFLYNARARFVVQAPGRLIGVVPHGGNLIDAAPRAADGSTAPDHFGELSFVYQLGRTCDHTEIEIVHDGSGGGAAVLRGRGRTAVNDYVNLRGVGILDVPPAQDPDLEDGMLCATTYVLPPDSGRLEVYFTLLNPGDTPVRGPLGTLSDTGGEVQVWAPEHGFQTSVGLDSLLGGAGTAVPYVVHQGPGVAYGIVPRHPDADTPNATFSVSGVSILLFGATRAVDLFQDSTYQLDLPARSGASRRVDVIVGRHAADIAALAGDGVATAATAATVREVPGTAKLSDGTPAAGARVGFFRDIDGDGALGPGDVIAIYADVDDQGEFRASVPAGNYLAVAEVPDVARSAAVAVTVTPAGAGDVPPVTLSLPAPVTIHYTISGVAGGSGDTILSPMPARLAVIGQHPVAPDRRLFPTSDRVTGTVRVVHAMHGTSMDLGAGSDPPLVLPVRADGPARYRIEVSRGLEWNTDSELLEVSPGSAIEPLDFRLEQALLTPGYVSSEYHVHQIGSPDAAVSNQARVASMLAEGVELFASTDHDFVADLQPLIVELGVDDLVRNIAGIEVTPFAYGHFNAWPLEPDDSPNHGAIDWARGTAGFAMIPDEIFAALRGRGADVVQINHPRSGASRSDFQAFFDRAALGFDLAARQIVTALGPVPNEWLRLPEQSLWSDDFDALEVWNGMDVDDSNGDGVRELIRLDLVMRDWFNFLSLGLEVTPTGNSDTHSAFADTAGMPRTYVRVADDSALALQSGALVAEVLDRLSGREVTRDVVVTNGPFVQVSAADGDASVIGAVLEGSGGRIALDVRVTAPAWAAFDTLEVFANATPEVPQPGKPLDVTALAPHLCYTSRPADTLAANDVCAAAVGGAQPLVVTSTASGHTADLRIEIDAATIATAAGATGSDAWLVVRARGSRAIFPVLMSGITGDPAALDVLLGEDPTAIEALLTQRGVPATAFTAPVYVDFDGNGYRAPFSPE